MPFLEQADLPKVVEQANKVSKDLLEWVDKGYKVITLTASCGLMLKFEWPLLLPKDDNIKRLSSNTMDIDEYVVDIANNEGLAEGLQEIDGGVTNKNASELIEAGADVLVAGSYVFKSDNPTETIANLKNQIS